MIAIYKITNPKNKIYIGRSINIEKRFKQYKSFNKSNNSQFKLIRSFKKYGVDNHIFEIVEECNLELLNIRERYWQDLYNVIDKNGLNLILTKTNEKPCIFSKETRLKMSNSHKGKKKKPFSKTHLKNLSLSHKNKKFSKETKNKMGIKVLQYDKNLNFIKEYSTLTEASNITSVHISGIQMVCSNFRKSAGGFIWKYKKQNEKRKYKKRCLV